MKDTYKLGIKSIGGHYIDDVKGLGAKLICDNISFLEKDEKRLTEEDVKKIIIVGEYKMFKSLFDFYEYNWNKSHHEIMFRFALRYIKIREKLTDVYPEM